MSLFEGIVKTFRVFLYIMPRKKICWTCIALFIAIWIFMWSVTSCQDSKLEEMKSIPTIEYLTNNQSDFITPLDIGRHFNNNKTFNWIDTKVPTDVQITLLDSKYRIVDYYFFMKFNNWYKKLKFESGIMAIDQKENLDCDNFALFYKSLMGVSSYKSSSDFEPAVAVIAVRQIENFGGIPTGGLHMMNLIFTNNGWFVFEPQTNKFILLEDYPNQAHIQYIII